MAIVSATTSANVSPDPSSATPPAPGSLGMAQRLREATHALHRETERAGIMPALLHGTLPATTFHRLQRNLHALYSALEPALAVAHQTDPRFAPWCLPPLARSPALAADLAALHGPGWAVDLPLAPATLAMCDRLAQLATQAPERLLAHAYVRYLGDLSGGQLLARRVRDAYALPAGVGTAFYDFGPPEQVTALAGQCRAALTALVLPETDAAALVDEALWAFAQHAALFAQLADPAPPLP